MGRDDVPRFDGTVPEQERRAAFNAKRCVMLATRLFVSALPKRFESGPAILDCWT